MERTPMNKLFTVALFSAFQLVSSLSLAINLKSETITGSSNLISSSIVDPNVMALILHKDQNSQRTFAILAEYDRKAGTHLITLPVVTLPLGPKGAYLTSWINRMYIYEVLQRTEQILDLHPLKVTANGNITMDPNKVSTVLQLKSPKAKSLKGATIFRYEAGSNKPVETISLSNVFPANSTWEALVPGDYFWSTDNTGGDYSKDSVNASVSSSGQLRIAAPRGEGEFQLVEKIPRIFVVETVDAKPESAVNVQSRIAVFIDIVNWKGLGISKFTTEEMLFINPDNPEDIGFFYERHQK